MSKFSNNKSQSLKDMNDSTKLKKASPSVKIQLLMVLVTILMIFSTTVANAQPIPTNEWISIYSDGGLLINGVPAPPGLTVKAFDPQGVLAGEFVTTRMGDYGLMSVYRDDPFTEEDEGAVEGDTLYFTVDGFPTQATGPEEAIWSYNGDIKEINLLVSTPELTLSENEVNFGEIPILERKELTLTLTNSGLLPLKIDSIRADFAFSGFLEVKDVNTVLESYGFVETTVAFTPAFGEGEVFGNLTIFSNAFSGGEIVLSVSANIISDVVKTNEWINIFSDGGTFLYGNPVQQGDVIDVYDPSGVHVGTHVIAGDPGSYGLMSIYRDDPITNEDEGAEPGDTLSFKINGRFARVTNGVVPIWNTNGDVLELDLMSADNYPPEFIGVPSELTFYQGQLMVTLIEDMTAIFYDYEDDELSYDAKMAHDGMQLNMIGHSLQLVMDHYFHGTLEVTLSAFDGVTLSERTIFVTFLPTPILQIDVQELNLDSVALGGRTEISFFVHNIGGSILDIGEIEISDERITLSPTNISINPEDSVLITVTFEPGNDTPLGLFEGEISFITDESLPDITIMVYTKIVTLIGTDDDENLLPTSFSLHQNYPNPFNPSTVINYELAESGLVMLKVFDLTGREIATLVSGKQAAGYYSVNFDASQLSSGIYIYQIFAENNIQSRKMTLIK